MLFVVVACLVCVSSFVGFGCVVFVSCCLLLFVVVCCYCMLLFIVVCRFFIKQFVVACWWRVVGRVMVAACGR